MIVPSLPFLGFAALFVVLVNLSGARAWRDRAMLVANLSFLVSFSQDLLAWLPFAGFVLGSYPLVEWVRRRRAKALWPGVAVVLGAFFWIKKYAFVPPGLLLPWPYVVIGISYIAFRILHLLIDAGQGQLERRIGLLDYLNYTLCFTCVVAGPIQMYPDYAKGLGGRPGPGEIGVGCERIVLGMFKVVVLSAAVDGLRSDAIAGILGGEASVGRWLIVVGGYAAYLYFNFSGYVDVVVGVARLMGLRLPENFDRPFVSTSFIEFWSRWHITLSTWLKTYVYSPLMMAAMRRFPGKGMDAAFSTFAFFLTFFLVGAWHGQTSEFLFFGVLQGGGVAVNKLYQIVMTGRLGRKPFKQLGENAVYRALARGLTIAWFAFTLTWFWGSWDQLGRLWAATPNGVIVAALGAMLVIATVGLEVMVRIADAWAGNGRLNAWSAHPYTRAALAGGMTFVVLFVTYLLSARPPTIVYKAF